MKAKEIFSVLETTAASVATVVQPMRTATQRRGAAPKRKRVSEMTSGDRTVDNVGNTVEVDNYVRVASKQMAHSGQVGLVRELHKNYVVVDFDGEQQVYHSSDLLLTDEPDEEIYDSLDPSTLKEGVATLSEAMQKFADINSLNAFLAKNANWEFSGTIIQGEETLYYAMETGEEIAFD